MSESGPLSLADAAASRAFGRALGAATLDGPRDALCIYLHGALGAGKTTVCQAYLRALGHRDRVPSPTYTLIEPYELGPVTVYHIDLYRLDSPAAVAELGLEELPRPATVMLVEWPERGAGRVPPADLVLALEFAATGRTIRADARTAAGQTLLSRGLQRFDQLM